jgi:hypothetical protein
VQYDHGATGFMAKLVLPINSPVKETIKSDLVMPTKRQAQQSVALKVAKGKLMPKFVYFCLS